jgi:hypothetical protein
VLIGTITASPKIETARLLQSRDGGMSFSPIFEGLEIASARYAEDGVSLLVADQRGLHRSDLSSFDFRWTSPASNLGCVLPIDGQVLVCGHYEGPASARSGVGISRDGGASFTTWLDFADVVAPVSCPDNSTTSLLCSRPWQDWTLEMSAIRAPADSAVVGSAPPAGPSLREPPAPPPGGNAEAQARGCSLSVGARGRAWWLLLPLLLARRRSGVLCAQPQKVCSASHFSRPAAHQQL